MGSQADTPGGACSTMEATRPNAGPEGTAGAASVRHEKRTARRGRSTPEGVRGAARVDPTPRGAPSAAYRFWGQMKVLQLANNVRELSPMNSVAE
jgi:hypothetical protein